MTKNEKKLMAVISDAVAGLEKANNPHVVKVRENLRKAVLQVNGWAFGSSKRVKQYQETQEFFKDTSCN